MGRRGGIVISFVVVIVVAAAAAVWALHIRSWPEVRDAALSVQRLTSPGYAGIFKTTAGPPQTAHATAYIVEILKTDNTVEMRTLSLPGVEGFTHDPFGPSAVRIYAQRVQGGISIAVDPDSYLLRIGDGVFDHVSRYGAVIHPAKLPKNYVGFLRDHAVAWHVEDGTKPHKLEWPNSYFQGLTACQVGVTGMRSDKGRLDSVPPIDQGVPRIEGELPGFAAGKQTFYITQPDHRACVHGGEGDNWNGCQDIPAFDIPNTADSSGRCPAMAVPLLDSCALVGELLMCNLESVVAVRIRRKVPLENGDNAPVYFISAPYLDGGTVLPPRSDRATYQKAVDTLTHARIKRALDVQGKMTPVPLNGG